MPRYRMTKADVMCFIDAELTELKTLPRTMPEDWHNGFIEGLKHIKKVLKRARMVVVDNPRRKP